MDATRYRRIKSTVHQQWYARWRLVRFASHLGFLESEKISEVAEVVCGTAPAPVLAKEVCGTAPAPVFTNEVRCWKSRAGIDALN